VDALYEFTSQPGVRRDGTDLDTSYYSDGVWVRWQRGRPRKMGGYRAMTTKANGPVRSVMLDSRGGVNSTHLFSEWGVQRVQFSNDGAASNIEDRTPVGFIVDPLLNWSHSSMYSATGGTYSAIIASSAPDLEDIASDATGYLYTGDIATNDPLVKISDGSGDIRTSGGICVLAPFLFVYGSNGLIRNSNANDYSTATGWTTGGANLANSNNVAGTKVIFGAPLRGGAQAPAGLFWALDSLVRVSFVGGTQLWAYDTLSNPTTILSKRGVVEHDGKFFWPGTDRFLFYNGVVQELPNQMNCNYFFDNLNYAHQNKVWGVKLARWGEIWWFYPRGADTECGNAVIFNYRENTWYDAVKQRSAGAPTGVSRFPVWVGAEDAQSTILLTTGVALQASAPTISGSAVLTFTSTTGVVDGMMASGTGIVNGSLVSSHNATTVTLDTNTTGVASGAMLSFTSMTHAFTEGYMLTGSLSGATGTAVRVLTNSVNVADVTGTFVINDVITGLASSTAKVQSAPVAQQLHVQYQHEYGWDKIIGQDVSAVESSFTSRNIGFAVGTPFDDAPKTVDVMTRTMRFEPDFNQVGDIVLNVEGRSFAQDASETLSSHVISPGDSFQDLVDQARILKLKVISNTLGGFYEQGQVMVKLEPGDERSTKAI
jgi:hypothetical protein